MSGEDSHHAASDGLHVFKILRLFICYTRELK